MESLSRKLYQRWTQAHSLGLPSLTTRVIHTKLTQTIKWLSADFVHFTSDFMRQKKEMAVHQSLVATLQFLGAETNLVRDCKLCGMILNKQALDQLIKPPSSTWKVSCLSQNSHSEQLSIAIAQSRLLVASQKNLMKLCLTISCKLPRMCCPSTARKRKRKMNRRLVA